jgi:predicted 3-demethylubiquinone-9 3-methyltransferase (glyoxalase superfamily)
MVTVSSNLWFADKAEEAVNFYARVVPNSSVGKKVVLQAKTPSGPLGSVYVIDMTLAGQSFVVLNAGTSETFNHTFSIVVRCEDQAELDRIWDGLLEGGGKPEACGWLKDRYGLSWQIVPKAIDRMMGDGDPARAKRFAEAMLTMVKFDIAALEAAVEGRA